MRDPSEITQAEAIGYGLIAGTSLFMGLQLWPWIREELRTPEPEFQGGSYLEELVGSIVMFVALGASIELNVKLYEAFEKGQWPTELGP